MSVRNDRITERRYRGGKQGATQADTASTSLMSSASIAFTAPEMSFLRGRDQLAERDITKHALPWRQRILKAALHGLLQHFEASAYVSSQAAAAIFPLDDAHDFHEKGWVGLCKNSDPPV